MIPAVEKVREALARMPRDRALTGFAGRGERYRRMVELAPHGIALLDLDGLVLDVNPAIERLLGRERDEIVGRSCTPFTYPEDHARELPLLEATLEGRRDGVRDREALPPQGRLDHLGAALADADPRRARPPEPPARADRGHRRPLPARPGAAREREPVPLDLPRERLRDRPAHPGRRGRAGERRVRGDARRDAAGAEGPHVRGARDLRRGRARPRRARAPPRAAARAKGRRADPRRRPADRDPGRRRRDPLPARDPRRRHRAAAARSRSCAGAATT